jgi:hypothetical protein
VVQITAVEDGATSLQPDGRLVRSKFTLAGGTMVTCPPVLMPGPLLATVTVVTPLLSGAPEIGVSETMRSTSSGRTVTVIGAWLLSPLTSFTSSEETVTRPSWGPRGASRSMAASTLMSSELPAGMD